MKFGRYIRYIVVFCVALSVMLSATFIKSDEALLMPYKDVTDDNWYFDSVYTLYSEGILDSKSEFGGDEVVSREEIVLLFYRLHKQFGTEKEFERTIPFVDVHNNGEIYDAICWAYANGIVRGCSNDTFNPDGQAARDELCTMVMRFVNHEGIKLRKSGNTDPFEDSLTIRDFARSHVVAARLSGIISGDGMGYFRPYDPITRAEICKILSGVMTNMKTPLDDDTETIDTTDGVYLGLYDEYRQYFMLRNHHAYVGESEKVDLSYFSDAAFVGDSVSMSLQYYCASTKALGDATFLCAGSLSPLNAHWPITDDSKHPIYKGKKMTVEDAVKECGAKKVYIMLGVNSLAFGLDDCVNDMVNLIDKISLKSPDARIILQSVTPMTEDSPIKSAKLNNSIINEYNRRMLELAQERGWFYVNVTEAVVDKKGNLTKEYCSDPDSMGIHFSFAADKVWIDYLRTHTPNI